MRDCSASVDPKALGLKAKASKFRSKLGLREYLVGYRPKKQKVETLYNIIRKRRKRSMLTDVRNEVSLRFMRNTDDDMSLLLRWLTNAEVLQHVYGEGAPWDIDKIKDKFAEKTTGESVTVACLILYQGQEIGYVQYYPIEEDSYKFNDSSTYAKVKGAYGIDMFIGEPTLWQKGIGRHALSNLEDFLRNQLNVHKICVDPAVENEQGTVFWKKVGFEVIDIIENYDDSNAQSVLMMKCF